MLAHSQGTFCRVVHFGINTTAPAVGLSRVPPKTKKTTLRIIWYHMLVCWLHEPEKPKKNAMTRTRTCSYSSKNITWIQYGKNQMQPSGTTFSNFCDNVAVLRACENAVALPHCS